MSRVTVALPSMIIGLLLGLSLSGSHVLNVARADEGCGVFGGSGKPPVIPAATCRMNDVSVTKNEGVGPVVLDGKIWDSGTIKNATLVYNGGAVELSNLHVDKGTVKLLLDGAAANTMRFLAMWEQFGKAPVQPFNPNAPVIRTVSISKAAQLSFTAK